MIWLIGYLGVGVFAGLAAGLLGVGGGIINVPALAWLFNLQSYPADLTFHLGLGTSLAIIVITGSSAATTHYRQGNVNASFGVKIAIAGVLGSVVGAYGASLLTSQILKPAFGVLLIFAGVQMLYSRNLAQSGQAREDWPTALTVGIVAGVVSGFFGVGGGVAAVPLMLWVARFEPKRAVGTSAMMVVFFGLFGGATYVVTGWEKTRELAWTFGYVHALALIFVALSSIFTARWGARLADRMNPLWLKRVFAVMLCLVGLRFISTLW